MEQNTTENVVGNKKKIFIAAGAVAIVFFIIYMGIAVYFMNHFHFRTTINGVNVSGASEEEAKEMVQNVMNVYELVIIERDGTTDSIFGKDIDLQVVWENQVNEILEKQSGFAWLVKLFKPDNWEPEVKTVFDSEKLAAMVNGLSCLAEEKQVAPQNAVISEYSAEDGYVVVPSVAGTQIDQDMLYQSVSTYVDHLETELYLEENFCYVQPEIKDDNEELLNTIAQLNKAVSSVITYQIGESTEVLDASVFQAWLYVDENGDVGIDEESVAAYVKGMASKYNTCYSAKKLMTSYGKEVTIKNSYYGWKVDNSTEREAIIAEILAGEKVTRDLYYSMTANSHEGNDYGNSYVEINLTAQHLFVYVDGKLVVESDFVSGDLSEGWGSPTGAYSITYRDKDAVLNGATYSTPVTYWMPFAGNVGMHDATWRDDFGGSIYKRDGSHGCINLPKEKAAIIFETVRKGFPVLCYELEGTQSEKGDAQDAAYVVYKAIKSIGEVTLDSEQKIVKARAQYDALSDMAKEYVSNYKKLVSAEKTLSKLKAEQEK